VPDTKWSLAFNLQQKFVGANQALYDADEKIYGSFPKLVQEIKTLYAKVQT
jgi:hypothetical protein